MKFNSEFNTGHVATVLSMVGLTVVAYFGDRERLSLMEQTLQHHQISINELAENAKELNQTQQIWVRNYERLTAILEEFRNRQNEYRRSNP